MAKTMNSSNNRFESVPIAVSGVIDLCPLVGFAVKSLERVEGDGLYIGFENGRSVAIDLLYDGKSLFITKPYAVDKNGHRINK